MRTITINKNARSTYDTDETFELGDLELSFDGLPADGGIDYRYYGFMNGTRVITATVSDTITSVTVPASNLAAGKYTSYISAFVGGKEARRYEIDALVITETDASFTADTQISALETEIAALKSSIESITAKQAEIVISLSSYEDAVDDHEERLTTLESNLDLLNN